MLTAGHRPGGLAAALPQYWEPFIGLVYRLADPCAVVAECPGPQAQIDLDRKEGKHAGALRQIDDAALAHAVRRDAVQESACRDYFAGNRLEEAEDDFEQGGFASSVGAENGADLAGDHIDRHAMQDVNARHVSGDQSACGEGRLHHTPA